MPERKKMKMRSRCLTGNRYGRWSVIGPPVEYRDSDGGRRYRYLCLCQCATERFVDGALLRSGQSRSCGCLMKEQMAKRNLKHGHSRRDSKSPMYKIWSAMKRRCSSPREKHYKDYGGRGITVCDRWLGDQGFENFLADMGKKPKGMSLDRIDNNGNYEPENCRWATIKEQNRNSRHNVWIEFRGETHIVKEWAEILGINYDALRYRLQNWPLEKAFLTPSAKHANEVKG